MNELYLIYVNHVGKDYQGNYIYEFIFSDTTEDIDGEDWDVYPASGKPEPPFPIFIKSVGILKSQVELEVVQNDNYKFAIWDAIDDVVALAWEFIDGYDAYPKNRLSFRFGQTKQQVTDKLYARDLVLEYNSKKYEKQS